ncbi:MAG: hypothetical protein ACRDT2_06395 [Natronosporangium sp.]
MDGLPVREQVPVVDRLVLGYLSSDMQRWGRQDGDRFPAVLPCRPSGRRPHRQRSHGRTSAEASDR